MTYFDEQLLRLKQGVKLTADQDVAAMLGMKKEALFQRKKRDAFPADKLWALATQRPDLRLDVTYILTGILNTGRQEKILTLLHPAAAAMVGEQALLSELIKLEPLSTKFSLRSDLLALEKQVDVHLEKGDEWKVKRLSWPSAPRGFECHSPSILAANSEAQKSICRLMDSAFGHTQREPRSAEYRSGAHALLEARLLAGPLKNPYAAGSAQADAWWAGVEEGKAIYRFHLSQGVPV